MGALFYIFIVSNHFYLLGYEEFNCTSRKPEKVFRAAAAPWIYMLLQQ